MKCCQDIKFIWVVILFVITTHNSFAQSYSITPNDSMEGSVPFNDLYHFIIQQNNLTEDNIILSWEKIYTEIPEGWLAYLCDLGFCYGDFPESGTMDTVPPGEYGLLSIGLNPFEITGTAVIKYSVWDENHPEKMDTLTWIINSESSTALESSSTNKVIIYPNPAKDLIIIHFSFQDHLNYKITNSSGINVDQGTILNSQPQISLNSLAEGVYFITIYDEKTVYSERFIIQR